MPREIEVAGIPIHDASFEETVALIVKWARDGTGGYVCTPNVDDIVMANRDPAFRAALLGARLRVPDGMGVVYGARLLGTPLRGTVTGRRLPEAVAASLKEHGLGIGFFGGRPGVADAAATVVRRQGGRVTVAISPPMGFRVDSPEDHELTVRIHGSDTAVVFACLGNPRQALWMERHHADLSGTVLAGVGAAVDVIAGTSLAAPAWMTRVGVEWLFRLLHDPRRLARRYLIDDPRFFWWVVRKRMFGS